jgi:lipopolysaccharide export system protein LptA
MRVSVSVERLRVWLLVGVGLLVLVIGAFLGYAHYRAHRFLTQLPGKLGVNIRQDTNSFTYSQSVGSKTVFTLHAAKAIQRTDGKYTLRDVGIVVYGRQANRADRIYGSEFELDQNSGVIRAMGEVHIDLQAPSPAESHGKVDLAPGAAHGLDAAGTKDEHLIHVKTSELVYLQKLGVAATHQEIEFESGGLTGHATGAEYSADTGVLVLQSAVKVNGLQNGRPVVLTASRAELDRANERAVLTQARYVSVGEAKDDGTEGQTAQAQRAIVHMRSDQSLERVEAEGDVTLTNGAGKVTAPRASVELNAESKPKSVRLFGGMHYVADEPLHQAKGESAEGTARFDARGDLERVVLSGAVHVEDRVRATDAANEPWSERELGAGLVDVAFVPGKTAKFQMREATATGNAHFKIVNAPVKNGQGPVSSALAGDVLTARFVRTDGADRLAEVHGDGHTALRRVSATGAEDTSSGDTLEVHMRPAKADAGRRVVRKAKEQMVKDKGFGGQGADEIATAVQQGNVVVTHKPAPKPGDKAAPAEQRATAERGVYDGDTDRLTLTGGVQVTDGGGVMWADRVAMEQQTGDAFVDGGVKATYFQAKAGDASSGEPVHILAARAELKRASNVAVFFGGAGRPARLWQDGSQVEAPVIEFEQKQRRLLAHGEGSGAPMAVHTVLVSRPAGKADAGVAKAVTKKPEVVRIVSREMTYSDEVRQADFTGGVEVDSQDGRMHARQAVVYLQAAGDKKAAGDAMRQSGFMGGSVDRVVGSGQIEVEQPGRQATGEQVVYTASDGMFVMTGTAAVPPKIVDEARGTVTGTSMRFHAGDDTIVISNEVGSGAGLKVRTETRVKK